MKTYKKVDTTLIPKECPSELAKDWQGGNKYPGIDAYCELTLERGQKIVQLAAPDEIKSPAMNSSGYYVLHEDYLRIGKNAAEFCNALQVAAWKDDKTGACSFRQAIDRQKTKTEQAQASRLAGIIDRNTGPAKTNTPQMSM